MKVPESLALIIADAADITAREIGFNRKFEIYWMTKKDKTRIDRFLFGSHVKQECIGLNLRMLGMDGIILDPKYLLDPNTSFEDIIDLVAHEVLHFKIVGHGKKFKRTLKGIMKKLLKKK